MKKSKRDYLIFTLCFQFIICALLIGLTIGLKKANNDLFFEIKSRIFSDIKSNFSFIDSKKNEKPRDKLEEEKKTINASVEILNIDESVEEVAQFLSVSIEEETSMQGIPENVCVSQYTLNEKIVSPVNNGTVTSEFGERLHPIMNEEKFHAGIDIAAESGSPIYASFKGVCIVADYDQWNGYYVKLQHEGDVMTVYCHCSKLNVKKGDKVNAGDVIAYVGSTGSSTGPHLHYEIRKNNVSLNPEFALDNTTDAV